MRSRADDTEGARNDVDEVARLVERFSRTSGFERRCRIGEAILSGLFDGSRLTWSARGPSKSTSFRELARRLEGSVSKSELHRSVTTHLLVTDLPFIAHATHLTVSHADAVEGLPRSDQERLLHRADDEKWNVRRLREEKRRLVTETEIDDDTPRRGANVAAPESAHSMTRTLKRKLEAMGTALRNSADCASEPFDESHHRRLVECLFEIRAECAAILRWLERGVE